MGDFGISIITVTKNDERRLLKTCQSIECQRNVDLEHIVVKWTDKGGKGEWWKQEEYQRDESYGRKTFELNDDGIYMAMNFGLAKSKGRFCLFLNAGDELVSENILGIITKQIEDDQGKEHYHFGFVYTPEKAYYQVCGFTDIFSAVSEGKLICQQSLLYNRRILTLSGGFDQNYKYAGDYEFICRSLVLGQVWRWLPVVGTIYEAGGISEVRSAECALEIERARNEVLRVAK